MFFFLQDLPPAAPFEHMVIHKNLYQTFYHLIQVSRFLITIHYAIYFLF